MKIMFVTPCTRDMPSSRMRCWQICDLWKDATCYQWDGSFPSDIADYDVVVFHKIANQDWIVKAREIKSQGVKVVLDICDPYYWWYPEYADMIKLADKVVVSSFGLKRDVDKTFGLKSVCITDRMPFEPEFKTHRHIDCPVLCWFGLSLNRKPNLDQTGELLRRLLFDGVDFKLRIIDEKPESPYIREPWVEHVRWTTRTIKATLMGSDVALLPTYPGIWGRVKSRNKIATAWWSGLPTTDGLDYFHVVELIASRELRATEGKHNRQLAEDLFDVNQSVKEWKQLVSEL